MSGVCDLIGLFLRRFSIFSLIASAVLAAGLLLDDANPQFDALKDFFLIV